MKYEDVRGNSCFMAVLGLQYYVEYMRDVAVRCGNFKKAFELQEKLEDIWFNYLKGVQ